MKEQTIFRSSRVIPKCNAMAAALPALGTDICGLGTTSLAEILHGVFLHRVHRRSSKIGHKMEAQNCRAWEGFSSCGDMHDYSTCGVKNAS